MRQSLRIRGNRLAVLGLLFCFLAALFAVEAKLAWYGPDSGPISQISASKLQPTDAPRAVAAAIVSSTATFPFLTAVLFVALIVAAPQLRGVVVRLAEAHTPQQRAVFFSPQVFFRPPPSL